MIKRIALLLVLISLPIEAQQWTPKSIFAKNKGAIVQIFVNGTFSGTGFIVSKDGLIATANHVVTTKDSKYLEFFPDITVRFSGDTRDHTARPLLPVTIESKSNDVAVLKIVGTNLPFVIMGSWNEVRETDLITVIASLLGYGNHLVVTGIVSGIGESLMPDAPPGVKTILFQAPIRNGFSGAPLFGSNGHVIGIVTTKVFGISEELGKIGDKAREGSRSGGISIQGVNIGPTVADLIDTLHFQLISGLGSAVDISYAKEMIKNAEVHAQ